MAAWGARCGPAVGILSVTMAYLPNGADERRQMLEAIGAASVEELFATVPEPLRHPQLTLPEPLAEQDLVAELERLAARLAKRL